MTTTAPHLSTDPAPPSPPLPDGLVVVVKRECETCQMVAPVLAQLGRRPRPHRLHPGRPGLPGGPRPGVRRRPGPQLAPRHRDRAHAHQGDRRPRGRPHRRLAPAAVGGRHRCRRASARTSRSSGRGAGRLSVDPNLVDDLRGALQRLGPAQPPGGAGRPRGRGRGPLRPRLDRRAARRAADRGPGARGCWRAPPDRPTRWWPWSRPTSSRCTVEKVAINAVMAGCKPEYLPVVLAASRRRAPTSSTSTACWPPPCRSVRC